MAVSLNIREVRERDLNRCYEIESASYTGDEAASKGKIHKRIVTYPQGFIVLEVTGVVVGFVNSGSTNDVNLSDEEFKDLAGHDENGKHIVIMSVVVHPDFQGKGYAVQLMKSFITKMYKLGKHSIHLICQTSLIALYAKFGFIYQQESRSEHGGLQWHEMILTIKGPL